MANMEEAYPFSRVRHALRTIRHPAPFVIPHQSSSRTIRHSGPSVIPAEAGIQDSSWLSGFRLSPE